MWFAVFLSPPQYRMVDHHCGGYKFSLSLSTWSFSLVSVLSLSLSISSLPLSNYLPRAPCLFIPHSAALYLSPLCVFMSQIQYCNVSLFMWAYEDVYPPVYLSINLSICLFVSVSLGVFPTLSLSLSLSLSLWLSLSPSVTLSLSYVRVSRTSLISPQSRRMFSDTIRRIITRRLHDELSQVPFILV